MKIFRKKSKGFTLIELLVVIAIIGILAAIAIPRFLSANETARGAKIMADLRTIDSAAMMFQASSGITPTGIASLASFLVTTPNPPSGSYRTPNASGGGGGSYGWSGTRATYDSKTADQF